MVSLHILQVGMNELTPVIYKPSLMEYGTASNLSPARQNHIIDPGSSTDASNKIICVFYQAWSFLRSSSGLHYKYCKFFFAFLPLYTISFFLLKEYKPTSSKMPEACQAEKACFKHGAYAVQAQAYTLMLLSTRNVCQCLLTSILHSEYLNTV